MGKKTLSKHFVLEKTAFGYVLIEREKMFPWGGSGGGNEAAANGLLLNTSFGKGRSVWCNLGHGGFLSQISFACIEVTEMCRSRFRCRL